MTSIQDKVVGSWFGMAVGDALGSPVRGLKPATIAQCFGQMDGFKDVRPFLGKGLKHYKMQGLYGSQTQMALVVCNTLLKKKSPDEDEMTACFQQLAQGGPEDSFGVYRQPEAWFRKAVDNLSLQSRLQKAEAGSTGGACLAMAIPIALYYQGRVSILPERCLQTCMRMSRNKLELTGTALIAFLINRFLTLKAEPNQESPAVLEDVLQVAKEFCRETEAHLKTLLGNDVTEKEGPLLSDAFLLLEENWRKLELQDILGLICRNASTFTNQPVSHAAQGYILTLLPLAVIMLASSRSDFAPVLTATLNYGGQADKLGAITGALAGALYGFSRIPQDWKAALVNAKEIRNRGEALFARRFSPGLKDLYEMESGLTLKEYENRKKYAKHASRPSRKTRTPERKAPLPGLETGSEDLAATKKENPAQWRKYQKDKTKKKRDRRRRLDKHIID